MVLNEPIETTQRLGQSNGATVNHASDARRVHEERQWDVTDLPEVIYEWPAVNTQRGDGMERCAKCNGYSGEPKKVEIGQSCEFDLVTSSGRSVRHSVKKGKLWKIWGKNDYTVIYRKTLYRVESVSHPDDPSPISMAMFGRCSCKNEQVA